MDDAKYVWNIAEVIKDNPLEREQNLSRTHLIDGKYCTALVVQAKPQEKPFIHIHENHDEYLYVIEGEGWAYIGDKKMSVRAGDFIYCPAGIEHGFFMQVEGKRLSIYGPTFDLENPDRVVPDGEDLK